ncbi:MAG TPA: carboxypeptidase-like regulatory domain-containing protein, partial [Hanamia sp.]|nr:carboxypeptidase-like regulatory domain-containing protein [Hanamia sp.]
MIRIWSLVCLVLSFSVACAQTTISGLVNSKDEKRALPGVSVIVKERNSTAVLAYAIADEKGAYKLTFKNAADSVLITVSGFNLKKQLTVIRNKSDVLNFYLTVEAIRLKEVKINPPKIRRLNDTLNYNVDG